MTVRRFPWSKRAAVVGFVGTNVALPTDLASAVGGVASLLKEKVSKDPCRSFYDTIDVAIAWAKPGIYKPAERFTTPIAFGIPTIGHSSFVTFRHYTHAAPFLCSNASCALDRLRGILDGTLSAPFKRLHDEVTRDVDDEVVAQLYWSTFRLTTQRSTRRAIAPIARRA